MDRAMAHLTGGKLVLRTAWTMKRQTYPTLNLLAVCKKSTKAILN